jgi:3-oxoacyl-[acyl-carrier protein] reductase
VLVNNGGIEGEVTDFHPLTDDDWHEVIDINLNGVFRCSRAAIHPTRSRGRSRSCAATTPVS